MVRIDPDKCIQCGMCVRECPHRLLTNTESGISAFGEGCIQCGHCVAVCPQEAVSLTEYDMSEVERVPDETERLDAAGLPAAEGITISPRRVASRHQEQALHTPFQGLSRGGGETPPDH